MGHDVGDGVVAERPVEGHPVVVPAPGVGMAEVFGDEPVEDLDQPGDLAGVEGVGDDAEAAAPGDGFSRTSGRCHGGSNYSNPTQTTRSAAPPISFRPRRSRRACGRRCGVRGSPAPGRRGRVLQPAVLVALADPDRDRPLAFEAGTRRRRRARGRDGSRARRRAPTAPRRCTARHCAVHLRAPRPATSRPWPRNTNGVTT